MYQFDAKSSHFGEREHFLADFQHGPRAGKGQIYFSLDLPDNPGAEDSISERLWRAFKDSYFNDEGDDAFLSFEEALKSINRAISSECKKRESGSLGRINSVAMVLDGNTLHFSHIGLSEMYLLRKGHLSRISEEITDEPQETFLEVASGELIADDRIVIFTRPFKGDMEVLIDAASTDKSRLLNKLKTYGKQQDIPGVLSVLCIEPFTQAEPITTSVSRPEPKPDEEAAPTQETIVKDMGDTEGDAPTPSASQKLRVRLASFRSHLDFDRLKRLSSRAGENAKLLGSTLSGLVRRPSSAKSLQRRSVALGMVAVLVLLVFAFIFQSRVRQQEEVKAQHLELLKDVKGKIQVAEQRFLIGDKDDAHDFLNTATLQLKDLESTGMYTNEIDEILRQIADHRDTFDQIIRISGPFVLADVGAKGPTDALGLIHTRDEKNYVYEPRRLFETILEKVQDPLHIDAEASVVAGTELEDNNALVFLTHDGRVIEYHEGRFEFIGTADSAWKRGLDVKTFSRFIYILDTNEGKIWKYPRLRTRYGNATQYNTEGDLKDAISIAIDGNIYALKRNGEILKFNKGVLQQFDMADQPRTALKNPIRIFTHAEAVYLYVLDASNQRVVLYSKGANGIARYQKQYVFEDIDGEDMRDMYVDQSEQKLLLLTKEKLYQIDL